MRRVINGCLITVIVVSAICSAILIPKFHGLSGSVPNVQATVHLDKSADGSADDYSSGTRLAINATPGTTMNLAYTDAGSACTAFVDAPETFQALVPPLNALVAANLIGLAEAAIQIEQDLASPDAFTLSFHSDYQRLISLCMDI